jgi:DNA-binding beta-propeller fold protein YncE
LTFGPDGNLYVASNVSNATGTTGILKFNKTTGASMGTFVAAGSGGLLSPWKPLFGNDGRLYVSDSSAHAIRRYSGSTGSFVDTFVPAGSGGLSDPNGIDFGPDGNLYVTDRANDNVLRYNGLTGSFIDTFIATGMGGLNSPRDLAFGPDGILYVSSISSQSILRYDASTGSFLGALDPTNTAGSAAASFLTFAVPEPSSSLIVSGCGGLLLALRRRPRRGQPTSCANNEASAGSGGRWRRSSRR